MKGDVWRYIYENENSRKEYYKNSLWKELDNGRQICIEGNPKGSTSSWNLIPNWFEKVDMKSRNYQSLYNKLCH